MHLLRVFAFVCIILYFLIAILLWLFQSRLIFHPGVLSAGYKFTAGRAHEVFFETSDGERLNGLYFSNGGKHVILYFHGNAGNLSGWQHVAEDFASTGYDFFIIDYRGYGKSSGKITEKGLYLDAQAAYHYLIERGFTPQNILIYGRSLGSGIAVDLASKKPCQGLILESPYASFTRLANEKFPLFFPSLYLNYRFDSMAKINQVRSPVIFVHGADDTLIPAIHSSLLFERFNGKKKLIIVPHGSHNDLNAFREYDKFVRDFPDFFLTGV